jgi:hypothetical protein
LCRYDRTFTTTATLSKDVTLHSLCKIIGHSGIKNLMIYAKIVNNEVKADMERVGVLRGSDL